MLKLGQLKNSKGAHTEIKRLGRGSGSGRGQTAGKGSKGQLQRTGGKVRRGFEGGQMPLYRRLPKKGFTNIFRTRYAIINLSEIDRLGLTEVSLESLKKQRAIKTTAPFLKVLGNGELKKAVTISAHHISNSAKEKVEKAGGKVQLITN